MKNPYQITSWCQNQIRQHVKKGDICIDATAGNGHDTLLLCQLAGETGKVYAFDVQEMAISNTKNRLSEHNMQADCILDGHQNMKDYVKEVGEVSCIVFNFGYLPSGNHSLSTKGETSIPAIEVGLECLKAGGIISLCIYSGGDSGFDEINQIMPYLKSLDNKKYLVIVSEYYNRPNNPPVPALIVKL